MAFRTERYGIQTEMRGARGVITNLNAIARALDATRLAGTKTFEIDRQIRRLGVQTGATSAEIGRLQSATLGLAQATGVSIDKTTELINAYQATGQSIGKLVTSSGKAVDTFDAMGRAGSENFRMMTNLVGRFGIGAAAAVKLERSIGHLAGPAGFGKLLDKTTEFSDRFNVPGLIGQLPKVVGFAMDSLSKFGSSVAGNSAEIINNTVRVGASFAQAFGVDAAEGISGAMAVQQRFLEQTRADQDVFLGLADDFDPLTKALQETGMSFQQIGKISRDAQKDPAAFAETMLQIRDQLGGEGNVFADRFFRNVQKSVPPAVQRLMTIPKALEDVRRAQKEAAEESGALTSFTQMADATKNIGAELLDTISRLALLGRTIVGLAFVEEFAEPLSGAVGVLKRFNTWLRETALTLRDSEWFKEWKPTLQAAGKVLIALGAAAGVVASTFAGMIIPFQTAMSVIRLIPVLGTAAGASFDGLGAAIRGFAKGVLKPLGVIAGIGVALNDFGQALADPTISERPMEVFVRGLRAMAVGIVEVFDNVLMGIPTQIAKWFYPEMQDTLGDATRRLFTDLQIWLETGASETGGSWWEAFKGKVKTGLTEFFEWMNLQMGDWQNYADEWGKNIGRAIGTLAYWAWEAISPLFRRDTWSRGWDRVMDYFANEGQDKAVDSLGSALYAMLGLVGRFTRNMVDEMLRPWGLGWLEVESKVLDFVDTLKVNFGWMQNTGLPLLQDKWLSFKVTFMETALAIKSGVMYAFESAKGYMWIFAGTIMTVWDKLQDIWNKLKALGAEAALKYEQSASATYLLQRRRHSVSRTDFIDDFLKRDREAGGSAGRGMAVHAWKISKEKADADLALRTADSDVSSAWDAMDAAKTAARTPTVTTVEDMKGNLLTGQQFTTAGRGVVDTAGTRFNTRRGEDAASIRQNMGGDLDALARYDSVAGRASRQVSAMAQAALEARVLDEQNRRHASVDSQALSRNTGRAQEDARNTAISKDLLPIKSGYIDKMARIIAQIEAAQNYAQSPEGNPKVARDIGVMLSRLRDSSRSISNARTGLEATQQWNSVLEYINRTPGLRDMLEAQTGTALEGQAYKSALFDETVVPSPGIASSSMSTTLPNALSDAPGANTSLSQQAGGGAGTPASSDVNIQVQATMDMDEVARWSAEVTHRVMQAAGVLGGQ